MYTQRDQFTGYQLPIKDSDIIISQHQQRVKNHPHSERAKMKGVPQGRTILSDQISIGDLIYLKGDHNKSQARDIYLVIGTENEWCYIRKFKGSSDGLRHIDNKYLCFCSHGSDSSGTDSKYLKM